MSIKDKLDIVLITYNRKACLEKVLEDIFAPNSPVRDFDITILNNASTDGTTELLDEYTKKFPNLRHIINNKNIGGCPNAVKAFVEIPKKEYVWVLADNDTYDWTSWSEVENAVEKGYDAIMVMKSCGSLSEVFYNAALVSGGIYKTSNITPTVIEIMYVYLHLIFPQLALISKIINDEGSIYVVSKNIIKIGHNPDHNRSFTRGIESEELPPERKYIYWAVGFFGTTALIKDRRKQIEIIEGTRHEHKTLFDFFKTIMVQNKLYYDNYFGNLLTIFKVLGFVQKLKFIWAFLTVNLSIKNYRFYEMLTEQEWIEYLRINDEQKYIDKLAKKLKNKKILLYGAGLTAEVILKNFDLSKINIIGVSDRKFEDDSEGEFCEIKKIKPSEMKTLDYDAILFTMKLYEKIAKSFKKEGINKKMLSIVKKSFKYPVRS